MKHIRAVLLAILFVFLFVLYQTPHAEAGRSDAPALRGFRETTPLDLDIQIVSMGNRPVVPSEMSFKASDEPEIRGYATNLPDDIGIWVLVVPRGRNNGIAWGPAHIETTGEWFVPRVRFGKIPSPEGACDVWAVACQRYRGSEEDPEFPEVLPIPDFRNWMRRQVKVSRNQAAVRITSRFIEISQVGGTDYSGEETECSANASIAGVIRGNLPPDSYIQILVQPDGWSRWIVVPSRAKVEGRQWDLPSVGLFRPERQSSHRSQIVAIVTTSPLPAGEVSLQTWFARAQHVSQIVPAYAADEFRLAEGVQGPILTITKVAGARSLPNRVQNAPQEPAQTKGTAELLVDNVHLRVVLHAIQSDRWWIEPGDAVLDRAAKEQSGVIRWHYDLTEFRAPATEKDTLVDVYAIATASHLPSGFVDRNLLKRECSAISARARLKITPPVSQKVIPGNIAVSIMEIGGQSVESTKVIRVPGSVEVSGQVAQSLPASAEVWLAVRATDSDLWTYEGKARVEGKTWTLPVVTFRDDAVYEVIAVVCVGSPDEESLNLGTWYPYVLGVSNKITVRGASAQVGENPLVRGLRQLLRRVKRMELLPTIVSIAKYAAVALTAIFALMLVALPLVLLDRRFRTIYELADRAAHRTNRFAYDIRDRFALIGGSLDAQHAFIATTFVVAAIIAITQYLGVYIEALHKVLSLPLDKAQALGVLLIGFTAIAGVLLDTVQRWGVVHTSGQSEEGESKGDVRAKWVVFGVLLVLVLLLWIFQAATYREYYNVQKALISNAAFTAHLFIPAVETTAFWGASHFGRPFFATVFTCIFWWPIRLLGLVFSTIAVVFGSFHRKKKRQEEEEERT